MNHLDIFLLDDNEVFLNAFAGQLSSYLESNTSRSFTLYRFTSGPAMLKKAEELSPNLVIADIELGPDIPNGIETVSTMLKTAPKCAVIYLTAYLAYAPDVFDTRPLYFILKSEYAARIPVAMKRFFQHQQETNGYISVTSNREQVSIPIQQLMYCERTLRVVNLFMEGGQVYPTALTIRELIEMLPSDQFSLCHRGYIVNNRFIASTKRQSITLTDGTELPLSRTCCDSFRDQYFKWLTNHM